MQYQKARKIKKSYSIKAYLRYQKSFATNYQQN